MSKQEPTAIVDVEMKEKLAASKQHSLGMIFDGSTYRIHIEIDGNPHILIRTRNRGLRTFKTYETAYNMLAELSPNEQPRVVTVIHQET